MKSKPPSLPQCPHCGEEFRSLKDGEIPTHDFPKPCRSVCKGAGKPPRRKGSALYKDDPVQEERDFVEVTKMELHVYGFAIVKNVAIMRGKPIGSMECPLCGLTVRYSIAQGNGHASIKCERSGCIHAQE